MFASSDYNRDLNQLDVSNVTNFSHAFEYSDFNQDLSSSWNVSSGLDFEKMFYRDFFFNQNMNAWGPQIMTRKDQNDTTPPKLTDMFASTRCPSNYTTPALHHFCQDTHGNIRGGTTEPPTVS